MQDNAILNAIAKRSSIREYTGEVVSRDQLKTIIKAGMAAPSAMNHQPWEFVAIDDRALLDKLGDVLPYAKMLHKAGAAIAVCGNVEKDCPAPYNSIWIHDCSAATENILLARSEEHTSELQSHSDLVCRLLLEKSQVFPRFPNQCVVRLYVPLQKRRIDIQIGRAHV